MRHEKIFKREDGKQFQIIVEINIDTFRNELPTWRVSCYTREPKQKKWRFLPHTLGDYQIRSLPMIDREKHLYNNLLRFVTPEEILLVKIELWQKIKPT